MKFSWLVSSILIQQFICSIPYANSAKILFFHSVASYSHRVATWPLAEALSRRGHEVTYISPHYPKEPNPNITEIVTVKHATFNEETLYRDFNINHRVQKTPTRIIDVGLDIGFGACEAIISSPEFKDWLKDNKKIDLIFSDNCYSECGVGIASKLSAKSIVFHTVTTVPFEYDAFGYLPESSAVPELEVDLPTVPMGFFARLSNALLSIRWTFAYSMYLEKLDHLLRNELKAPEMPFIGDLMSKVNLIFFTGDVISDYPRSLPPNFINVAGIHCKESTKGLPESIENFIQANQTGMSDNDGFVYISLGSFVVSSNLPDSIKQIFFDTIRSFPNLKFLWKWNGDFPKEIPDNLYLGKWFPQIDVLAHPKIRAFVTQSGRPSTMEALFNGVPLISFPVVGDQDFNANRLAETGAAIKFEIAAVTKEEFKEAIQKSVYDPRTKARMTKFQKIFRDRPMSPLDTALWWTEYVLRMEDTLHLRPAGADQSWFVRRQIDVWAFLSIGTFVMLISSLLLVTKIAKTVFKMQPKLKSA